MRVALKLILVLVVMLAVVPVAVNDTAHVAQAQGNNLLQSPQFTGGNWYTLDGIDGQLPGGWSLWANGQKPASDYNQFLPYTRSAPGSWEMRGGYVAWTGGGYQQVNGVTPNVTYRFTIYAFAWTCNDIAFSCTDANGRTSDKSFNSRIKVGIDPTGGTDPNSGNIVWSGLGESYDTFSAFTVDAIATNTTITVFTYNTVSEPPPALRQMFWDDASLVALGEGEGNPGNPGAGGDSGNGDVVLNAPDQTVPFVQAQSAQPDGSVVHTVVEGDTINSIYVAYRYLGITRESFYQLNGWGEEPPGVIFVGEQIQILPPGSVDPTTGQLLTNRPTSTPTTNTGIGGTGSDTTDTGVSPSPTTPPSGEIPTGEEPATIEKGG